MPKLSPSSGPHSEIQHSDKNRNVGPTWLENTAVITQLLENLCATDLAGQALVADKSFKDWANQTVRARSNRKTVYLIGNGASASMASHMSADLAKNAHVHTQVFTDMSLLTAVANDISFAEVFAEPLRRCINPEDMLVAISSSGNSPNVVRAVNVARDAGAFIVTLSAMDSGNSIRTMGDLNYWLPARTYGLAETSHAAILHYWMDLMALTTNT